MRRFPLLLFTLVLTLTFPYTTTVVTQEANVGLPDLDNYPAADANCKDRRPTSPGVTVPAVDWPKTFRCQLVFNTCDGRKIYRSEVRNQSSTICDDYWEVLRELAKRELCCDPNTRCNDPKPGMSKPPWFDRNACGDPQYPEPMMGVEAVDVQRRPLPAGQVRCVATYFFCSDILTGQGGKTIEANKIVSIDPALQNSGNSDAFRDATSAACQQFFDDNRDAPRARVCCDVWDKATDNIQPGQCDGISDPDCDGLPNHLDPFPLHPRSTDYVSGTSVTQFPFWRDLENAIPGDLCDCQWEFIDARYKCTDVAVHSSSRRGKANQAKYEYEAKWKCRKGGREVITKRQVTMPGVYCPRSRK